MTRIELVTIFFAGLSNLSTRNHQISCQAINMASLNALDAAPGPGAFSPFLKLPIELRAEIWAIVANCTPRLIEVTACDVYHDGMRRTYFKSRAPMPPIFHAKRESRSESQRFYKRMFEDLPTTGVKDRYIYLNPAIDIAVFLSTPEEDLRPRYVEMHSTGLDINGRPSVINDGYAFHFPAPLDTFQKAVCDWSFCFADSAKALEHAAILLCSDWSNNLACTAAGLSWCTNLKTIVLIDDNGLNRLAVEGFRWIRKGVKGELVEIKGEWDGDELSAKTELLEAFREMVILAL
jgi:hypothetical protein